MAPKTRAKKTEKENVSTIKKCVLKDNNKVCKPARKPLADKTNSASDDNTSIVVNNEPSKKNVKISKAALKILEEDRPRRLRRVPNRFIGNVILANISNSKDKQKSSVNNNKSQTKNISSIKNFTKTPPKVLDNSLLKDRPKRISRLPSKLEDHSISLSKFIPVKPCSASTPIRVQKVTKPIKKVDHVPTKVAVKKSTRRKGNTKILQQITIESFVNKLKPDTNNNSKKTTSDKKALATKRNKKTISPDKTNLSIRKSSKNSPTTTKSIKVLEKSFSFRVLDDKKSSNHENKNDIYEFTFDPTKEPKPQKKKRKRVYNKRPTKPKTIVMKSVYDKNVAQSLQALKSMVGKKPIEASNQVKNPVITDTEKKNKQINIVPEKTTINCVETSTPVTDNIASATFINSIQNMNTVNNHVSVRIEDIAAQLEPTPECHDIDYSPVNSPSRCSLPDQCNKTNDPLNLQPDLSFFDDQPVASSSMNISNRHPTASPWRVNFKDLPIKWKVNSYVKPNLTPAYESSYIETDNKKKHVYTNILSEPNKSIPDAETISTQLKQTSMISFIKEVVNRSLNKKKKKNLVTPTKQNSLFEDAANNSVNQIHLDEVTPRKCDSSNNQTDSSENAEKSTESNNEEQNNAQQTRKRKIEEPIETVCKTAKQDKDPTLFGFDESENCDQENVSPIKIIDKRKKRNLRRRAGAVLQELNVMSGPTRAVVPAKAKLAMNSEVVNKIYEELKSAETAPVFPERDAQKAPEVTNTGNPSDDESQSVHLFEDIELVHHLKPTRKSYGKAKKVTFHQHSSDSDDSRDSVGEAEQDSYDDLADLSFGIPVVKAKKIGKKKLTKKQKNSKKQEQEVDEWAAQFNSMCKDIENVDLVVE